MSGVNPLLSSDAEGKTTIFSLFFSCISLSLLLPVTAAAAAMVTRNRLILKQFSKYGLGVLRLLFYVYLSTRAYIS
jgi:hypothetical protein